MAILNSWYSSIGEPQNGTNVLNGRLGTLVCNDIYATIINPGYLNTQGVLALPGDFYFIVYGSTSNLQGTFIPSVATNGIITLLPYYSAGELIPFNVTATATQLASAGKVNILAPTSPIAQFRINSLQLNLGGVNFSGGSGDRLAQVTDGTSVYTVIPAATLQTLVNAQWGVTALPNPASVSINTPTTNGANLYIAYSGGTLDYTTGTMTVTGTLYKVA